MKRSLRFPLLGATLTGEEVVEEGAVAFADDSEVLVGPAIADGDVVDLVAAAQVRHDRLGSGEQLAQVRREAELSAVRFQSFFFPFQSQSLFSQSSLGLFFLWGGGEGGCCQFDIVVLPDPL